MRIWKWQPLQRVELVGQPAFMSPSTGVASAMKA
jgi:hypothetical protein